jgi:hypothetical protein
MIINNISKKNQENIVISVGFTMFHPHFFRKIWQGVAAWQPWPAPRP